MSLVRDTIINPIGGVSQQADKIMYPNQAKELKNYLLSLSEGLKKRPPTEHIAKLMNGQSTYPLIQTVIKEGEKYIVVLTGTGIKVFDFTGTEKTVTMDSATATALTNYITTTNPLRDLEVTTIGDYTFILNKTKKVQLSSTSSANPRPYSAIIFVKQADFGVKYTVTINSTTVTYTIPVSRTHESSLTDSGQGIGISYISTNNDEARTTTVAAALVSALAEALGTTNWSFAAHGTSTILVTNTANQPFTILATDSNGNNNISAFYKEANGIQLLPTVAPNNSILKIIGEKQDKADDYYVKFKTADDSTFGYGTWSECCAPNIQYKLDPATMPHALVRNANGTFTYKVINWTDRKAGDEESAPSPSFVGQTIDEVFTHKGRLGFLSADKTILSNTEDIFSFFKQTCLAELDTDPIDIMSNSKMVNLKHSMPFNEELMVFSPTAQFTVKGGDVFSNSTVAVDLVMNYPCSTYCKPINTGATGLFIYENGNYSRVKELFRTTTYALDARDVTEQCPNYLPKDIFKMAGSEANDIVCFISTQTPSILYVYNYYYSSEQKSQSAWCEWEFKNGKILNVDFDDNLMYLFIQYTDGIYLLRMNFTAKITENNLDYLFYLDRKAYINTTYVNGDYTTINLPYPIVNELTLLDTRGFPIEYENLGNQIRFKGEYKSVVIGEAFDSKWKLGTVYLRQQTQNGGLKTMEGLLMLKDMNLSFINTGYFKVTVTPKYSTAIKSEFEFTGKIEGHNSSTLEKIPISDGSFLIPLISKNEDITIQIDNNTYLPSTFLSYEWLGDFVQHGQ